MERLHGQMAKTHQTTKEIGDQFELDVQAALEAMGFDVQRNLSMVGNQVDMIASRQGVIAPETYVVEAKSYSAPIGVEAIRSFSSLLHGVRRENPRYQGLFVSRSGFTAQARAFADEIGLTLFSYSDLLRQTFDIQVLIRSIIEEYESQPTPRSYIPLACRTAAAATAQTHRPAEDFLDNFFSTTRRYGCVVLGDFGTGKTSLCRHYAYLLSKRWTAASDSLVPIFLALRDIGDLSRLQASICTLLSDRGLVTIDPSRFLYISKYIPFLFIIDGLDELATRMDNFQLSRNLSSLQHFAGQTPNCRFIITCRTHFFRTRVEEDSAFLPNFLRLYISEWGENELRDYVQLRALGDSPIVLEAIEKTYDLKGLARVPLFLKMIMDRPEIIRNISNHAKLYEIYTEGWIQDQAYRSMLSTDKKRELMAALAFEMWTSPTKIIHYSDLPKYIGSQFHNIDYRALTDLDSEIRTCSFLVRDESGNYRFVHPSYMDFFVARFLAEKLKSNDIDDFGARYISNDIAGFIACYLEMDWKLLLQIFIGISTDCRSQNAIAVASHLRPHAELESATELAISIHENDKNVVRRIIDCWFAWKSERAISMILKHISQNGTDRIYAIRHLVTATDSDVAITELKRLISEETDSKGVAAAVESVTPDPNGTFSTAVRKRIEEGSWKTDLDLDAALLSYVTASDDIGFIASCDEYLSHAREPRQKELTNAAIDNLRNRLEPKIRLDVQSLTRDGHSIDVITSTILSKYRFLAMTGTWPAGFLGPASSQDEGN